MENSAHIKTENVEENESSRSSVNDIESVFIKTEYESSEEECSDVEDSLDEDTAPCSSGIVL